MERRDSILARLKFDLPSGASPARVAEVASAIRDLLTAVSPGLDQEGMTLVIDNFETKGELRAWSPGAATVLGTASDLLDRPEKLVRLGTEGVRILRDSRKPLAQLASAAATFRRPRAKKALRLVDSDFMERIDTALQSQMKPPSPSLTGEDVIVSQVYRVGRAGPNSALCARITAYNENRDVHIPHALADTFFDAAKAGDLRTITVGVTWRSSADGKMVPDPTSLSVRAISSSPTARAPFSVLLDEFASLAPNAFMDVSEAIRAARGDG